ncbi:MAG: outer membrane beta-barrel protein [Bacteroidales bacterium]|nr:outer membrane beta-barrel protein [Bacteroidales bacterium]
MKRIFNTIVIIIALSLISSSVFSQNVQLQVAQKGEVVEAVKKKPEKPKKEKIKTDFTREKGFYLRPEIGVGGMLGNRNGNIYSPGVVGMIGLNFGYQVNHSLAVGIGLGYHMAMGQYSYWTYEYNNDMNMTRKTTVTKPFQSLPIYANLRWYITDTKVQPYLDIRLGYLIGIKRALVDVSRTYLETGMPYSGGTGTSYYSGVWDSWNQYDDYAKMQGFHGTLAIGFSVKNGFGMCLEASLVRIVFESEKVYHKEIRTNGMPDWEYEDLLSNKNQTKSLSTSAPYAKLNGMVSLKLEYNIPITKKKQ